MFAMVHPRELQRVTMVRVRHVEKWLRALLKKHQLKPRRLWVCGLMTSIFLGLMTLACYFNYLRFWEIPEKLG